MPPKPQIRLFNVNAKQQMESCWNSGTHVVEGRHVCGTHAKGCKGGFATHAELEASAIEFQQRQSWSNLKKPVI